MVYSVLLRFWRLILTRQQHENVWKYLWPDVVTIKTDTSQIMLFGRVFRLHALAFKILSQNESKWMRCCWTLTISLPYSEVFLWTWCAEFCSLVQSRLKHRRIRFFFSQHSPLTWNYADSWREAWPLTAVRVIWMARNLWNFQLALIALAIPFYSPTGRNSSLVLWTWLSWIKENDAHFFPDSKATKVLS